MNCIFYISSQMGGKKKKSNSNELKKNPKSGTSDLQHSRFFGATGPSEGNVWQLLTKSAPHT